MRGQEIPCGWIYPGVKIPWQFAALHRAGFQRFFRVLLFLLFLSFSARMFGFPFMTTGKRFTRYLDFSLLRVRSFPDRLNDATSAPLRAGCLATSGLGIAENGYPVVFKSRSLDARMIAGGQQFYTHGQWRWLGDGERWKGWRGDGWWCALASCAASSGSTHYHLYQGNSEQVLDTSRDPDGGIPQRRWITA